MDLWDRIFVDVSEPLDLGCPVIEVETSSAVDVAQLAQDGVARFESSSS
jgi:hypothetical protein